MQKTLASVFAQDYENIQVIVVDDCSTDGSQELIAQLLHDRLDIPFLSLKKNLGNTKAFNQGLALAEGKYVIDLSCDDILYPDKISKQVAFFESLENRVGVIYSDVRKIDKEGNKLAYHFRDQEKLKAYSGDVYERLVDTYFLPTQSMMIRKIVLDELGGYDEELAYEDFDFWVRSSRNWHYAYQDEVLMDIIKHGRSFSVQAYKHNDRQLYSTYLVCEKIKTLNQSNSEDQALTKRLKFELRQAVFSANHRDASLFGALLAEMHAMTFSYQLLLIINQLRLDLNWLRDIYHKLRYGS